VIFPQKLAKISRIYTRKEEGKKKKVLCYENNQKMSKKKNCPEGQLRKTTAGASLSVEVAPLSRVKVTT